MFPVTVKITVDGIPAQAYVKDYRKTKGSYSLRAIDPEQYYGSTELDYEIRDRKGYKAPWLEDLMDRKDIRNEVEIELMSYLDDMEIALKEDYQMLKWKERR